MVVSGQRHGKDPLASRRDLLTRLPTMNNREDLAPLLPCHWTPTTSLTTIP
jgi:hypothetical protein